MKNKIYFYLSIITIVFSFISSIYLYPFFPSKIVSHWNYYGIPDGYTSRFWGVFLLPIMMVLIFVLTKIFSKLDPKINNIKKFEKSFDWFLFGLNVFFFILHIFLLLWNLGIHFSINKLMAVLFALLFFITSILLKNSKQNYFIGIRNPWTLHSEIVWDKTHILASKLFQIVSGFCLAGLIFPNYLYILFFFPLIIILISIFIYSYLEFKKL